MSGNGQSTNYLADKLDADKQHLLDEALQALEAVRKFEEEGYTHGLKRVDLYYNDGDGSWLEEWGEDDSSEPLSEDK